MKNNSIETFLRELDGSIVGDLSEIVPTPQKEPDKVYGTPIGQAPKGFEYLDISNDLYYTVYDINSYDTMSDLIFKLLNSRIYVNVGEDITGDFNCEAIEIIRLAFKIFDDTIIEKALENLIDYYMMEEEANINPKSDLIATYYDLKYR